MENALGTQVKKPIGDRLSRWGKIRLVIGCIGLISATLYYSINSCLQ